jgi:hypothetical protein
MSGSLAGVVVRQTFKERRIPSWIAQELQKQFSIHRFIFALLGDSPNIGPSVAETFSPPR